ncbi:hypothetical protein DQ384_39200 [Sphaerisporangium album]|uniref:Uncharacterized protein n=1 Tax=Sphaerisporangium album TaxID=509200 RepID=A0A367EJH3_9ACTN|nr:hypothetical protein [Sphaerisporangium album]RCG18224.1 hypothetical protein DQ384_39200 [Sphaerisporangium album]
MTRQTHPRDLPDLHADARALTAFRALPDGTGRAYTISEAPDGRAAIARTLHRAKAIGYVKPPTPECGGCYAVLDILNHDDEPVQDLCIPTARAFRWWYRTIHLRVERPDS